MIRIGLVVWAFAIGLLMFSSCKDADDFRPCIVGEDPFSDTMHRYDTNYYDAPSHFSIFPKTKVKLVSSNWHGFKVSAQGNVNSRLSSVQREDTMYLDFKNCVFRYDQVSTTVHGSGIEGLTIRDSSTIDFDVDYTSPSMTLRILGPSDGNISGNIDLLTVKNNSGRAVTHNGTNSRLDLRHTGNGVFNAEKATIRVAVVSNYGTGDVFMPPVDTLVANILDSGNVYYLGTPEIVSNVVGTGRVIQK